MFFVISIFFLLYLFLFFKIIFFLFCFVVNILNIEHWFFFFTYKKVSPSNKLTSYLLLLLLLFRLNELSIEMNRGKIPTPSTTAMTTTTKTLMLLYTVQCQFINIYRNIKKKKRRRKKINVLI